MAFNPIDFYQLASWLQGQQNQHDEARARTVISRAYYGAFLEARNKAGITKTSGDVHRAVHSYYSNLRKTALANRLDNLRLKRNDADYDTAQTITSMESGRALKLAKRILEDLGFNFS